MTDTPPPFPKEFGDPLPIPPDLTVASVEPLPTPLLTPSFEVELCSLIGRHSRENASGTPNHILARYLARCLDAFDDATRSRDGWWDFDASIAGIPFADSRPTSAVDQ